MNIITISENPMFLCHKLFSITQMLFVFILFLWNIINIPFLIDYITKSRIITLSPKQLNKTLHVEKLNKTINLFKIILGQLCSN